MAARSPRRHLLPRWPHVALACLLLCYTLLARTANAHLQSTTPHLVVHRRRTCALTTLWDAHFADIPNVAALETQWTRLDRDNCSNSDATHAVDAAREPCWSKQNVQIASSELTLGAPSVHTAAKVRTEKRIDSSWAGHLSILHVRARFAHDTAATEAVVRVYIRPLDVHMSFAIGAYDHTNSNKTLRLASSQFNASIVAEIPCFVNTAAHVHVLAFSWDVDWLRWHVDDTIVYEEPVHKKDTTTATTIANNATIVVEISVVATGAHVNANATAATQSLLAIERVTLQQGDAADVACAPRHHVTANCRHKTPFTPRLGANQGSLSTSELDAFVNETLTRLPTTLTRVETIGTTIEGRAIRALCLGACDAKEPVPQALFTGMHHARENLVYTIDLLVLDVLNGDVEMLALLFARQLWFVLVVNPDGYARNEAQRVWDRPDDSGQRKNVRSDCAATLDSGVDLNRNYDVCFAHDDVGSSSFPCAEDYRGPHAFSEPETQAIRTFVERQNVSTALNYHSFGRFVNIPFACKASGVPGADQLAIFQDMAAEMTRFNHFKYGQPWTDSNLYSVNGETSDWMWQQHRIYAMSPEVGPDFDATSHRGFWPLREHVAALSVELHYANLHAATIAGAIYDLRVRHVRTNASVVSIDVTLTNVGLRTTGAIELLGSMYPNGSHASDVVHVAPHALGTIEAIRVVSTTLDVPLRAVVVDNMSSSELQLPVYVVLRDAFGCRLYRIAIDWTTTTTTTTASTTNNTTSFQLWTELRLPRCGLCVTFGHASSSSTVRDAAVREQDAKCVGFDDVTTPHGVRLKRLSKHEHADSDGVSTVAPVSASLAPHTPRTPSPPPTRSDSNPNARSANANDSTTSRWDPTSFYVLLPLVALVALVLLLVVVAIRRRRRYFASAPAGSTSAAPVKRRSTHNQRYSRVVSDEVTPSPRNTRTGVDDDDATRDDDSNEYGRPGNFDLDSDDELELKIERVRRHSLGRRPLSPRPAVRSPPSQRTASPSANKQPVRSDDAV